MNDDARATIIDMTPDGGFAAPPAPPWSLRAKGVTALAVVAGGLVLVLALAIWLAITVVPVLIVVALVAIAVARLRRWRRGGTPRPIMRWTARPFGR